MNDIVSSRRHANIRTEIRKPIMIVLALLNILFLLAIKLCFKMFVNKNCKCLGLPGT
jgi:hypothetical protein